MFLEFIHALGKMPEQKRAALIVLVKWLGITGQKDGEQGQGEFSGPQDLSSDSMP